MLYCFDGYSVDTDRRTLSRGDALIELTPKVFQTLVVLIENSDHVMSKDELMCSIWPDHTVEEANITQNISVLRRALEERSRGKKYIATFPGIGYRFLEPVAIDAPRGRITGTSNEPLRVTPRAAPSIAAGDHRRDSRHRGAFRFAAIGIAGTMLLVAVTLTAFMMRGGHSALASISATRPIEVQNLRTIVRMEGASFEPALSGDGRTLAFVHTDPKGDHSAIEVRFPGMLEPREIASGDGEYSSPVFSPDAAEVAFLHLQANAAQIEVVNLKTRRTHTVANVFPRRYGLNCRHLDWSPDGRYLVVDDKDTEADPLSLYLVTVSSGVRTRISTPSMDIIGDVAPRFSPDSTRIAFVRMKYQYEYDVYVVPISGGDPKLITPGSTMVGDVDWAGNHRLLYSADNGARYKLWSVDLSRAPILPALASTYENDMPLQFAIARKAMRVALSAYRPDLNIWSVDLRKRPGGKLQWTPAVRTPGQDIGPVFSPDGSEIAFRSDVNGRMQLWISRPDGSAARAIDTGDLRPAYLTWAPDGSAVAYSVKGEIFESSTLRNEVPKQLTTDGFSHPDFSVDGRWIFARQRNVIYRLPADRPAAAEKVTDDGGAPIMQSRDGRFLFFGHGRMDTTVSRLDLRTGEQTVVIKDLVPGYRECWTPAPGGLIYLSERSGRPTLVYHSLDGGRDAVLGEFPGPLPPVATSRFTLSPDGSHLIIVRADPASASVQEGDLQFGNTK